MNKPFRARSLTLLPKVRALHPQPVRKQNIQDCSPRYATKLAEKATVTAEKAAEREKRAAKKRKRVSRLAADKRAMKAAERDPQRLMPGLSRLQLASVKTEMCTRGKSFPPWSEPVPMSAAAIAELAKIAAEKKSEAAAKRDQSKKRREDKHAAERRDTIIAFGARQKRRKAGCGAQQPLPVKREPVVEESMGPPPPPPLPEPSKSKKRRKAGCGAQQPLPVKREPVVEESMGPPPPPPPLLVSNGDEVRCCGFLWIASVASRL